MPKPSEIDVVHLHGVFGSASHVAYKMARQDVPVIVRPCGMLEHASLALGNSLAKSWHLRLIEEPLLRLASAIHLTSHQEDRDLLYSQRWQNKVVIPLGVDVPDVMPTRDKAEAGHLLFFSRLHNKKQPEWLIDLLAESPHHRATFAGGGDPGYIESLRRYAQARGVADRAVFVGHVDKGARDALMARAQLMVLPSKTENFAAVVVEAWGQGLPTVLTSGVALAEVARAAKVGRVCGIDYPAFAKATLGYQPSVADSRRAHRLAQTFSWTAFTGAVEALYERVQ